MNTNNQVIKIQPDGTVVTLMRKRGAGFDPRPLGGEVDVQRVSMVEWNANFHGFTIDFLLGKYAHRTLTVSMLEELGISMYQLRERFCNKVHNHRGFVVFDDYEDAVACEVTVLDTSNLEGI